MRQGVIWRQYTRWRGWWWLALAAVWLATAAPTVSRALVAIDPVAFAPLCRAGSAPDSSDQGTGPDACCPYCLTHVGAYALPPPAFDIGNVAMPGHAPYRASAGLSVSPQRRRLLPSPRGPPLG